MTSAAHTELATYAHASRSTKQMACLTFLLLRSLNAWVATCSAAIQRRHLMVWALFAPKFLFEVCFLAVADVSMLALTFVLL